MSEEKELEEYRQFLKKLSIYVATSQNEKIGELLSRVRLLGYAWGNSSGDPESDEEFVNNMIKNLNKPI